MLESSACLSRLLSLLAPGSALATSDAAEPLLAAAAALARGSAEAVVALESLAALHTAAALLATRAGEPGTAGAATAFFLAMVDCSDLAALVAPLGFR